MSRESLCIKVPKAYGEKTIILANKLGLSDRKLVIQSDEQHVRVPIINRPSEKEMLTFKKQIPKFHLDAGVFQERTRQKETLTEVLENQLPSNLMSIAPKALDIIGNIAIVEIPPELKTFEKAVGEAILKTHKNVKTVLAKSGAIGGEYRLRKFDLIAGEHKTKTIHKEFGCQYHIDVANAYFSPRLSYEHNRVASLVKKGEIVVDLFAGVGPFAVLIAKKTEDVKVYALDINPDAVELLKKNIRLNRVQNYVVAIVGDARKIVKQMLLGTADRVIMNLPESAIEFVDVACQALKHECGVAHFYNFVRAPDSVEALKNRVAEAVGKAGRKVEQFLSSKAVRETAPYEWQIVLDAKIV